MQPAPILSMEAINCCTQLSNTVGFLEFIYEVKRKLQFGSIWAKVSHWPRKVVDLHASRYSMHRMEKAQSWHLESGTQESPHCHWLDSSAASWSTRSSCLETQWKCLDWSHCPRQWPHPYRGWQSLPLQCRWRHSRKPADSQSTPHQCLHFSWGPVAAGQLHGRSSCIVPNSSGNGHCLRTNGRTRHFEILRTMACSEPRIWFELRQAEENLGSNIFKDAQVTQMCGASMTDQAKRRWLMACMIMYVLSSRTAVEKYFV